MSDFSNLQETKIRVGDNEVHSFHIPVSEPSPRHRKNASAAAAASSSAASPNKYLVPQTIPAGQIQQAKPPAAAGRPGVPRVARDVAFDDDDDIVIPPTSASPARGSLFPRPPAVIAGTTTPNRATHSPSPPPTYAAAVQQQQQPPRGSLMVNSPPGGRTPSPKPTTNASPRPSMMMNGPPTMVQPFSLNSTASPSPAPLNRGDTHSGVPKPQLMRSASLLDQDKLQNMGLAKPVIDRINSVDASAVATAQKVKEMSKPDISKAERYRNLTCPRVRDTSKGTYGLHDIWKFSDPEFLQYGLGVMLWFKLVRRLSYLFVALFIINLPSLIFNILGPDSDSTGSSSSSATVTSAVTNSSVADPLVRSSAADSTYGLSKTTLAHQGLVLNATILGYSKAEVGVVTGGCDALSVIVFLLTVLWIFRDHAKHTSLYNSAVMTVRRFTVLVTELPKTAPLLTRLDIADFFQQRFGPVVDVSIAYNDMHLIQLFKQRGEMKKEMLNLEANGHLEERDEIAKKLVVFDKTIMFKRKIYKKEIRAAFVTFQQQESVTKCLSAYPDTWWSRVLMSRNLRFHRAPIRVVRAAEPSNTLFHNLGLSYGDQWCRRAWTGLVSLAFMSLSFAAVFVSQYYQNRLPSSFDCASSAVTTQEQVVTENDKNCYCGGLSATELYNNVNFCSSYITQFSIAKGLIFMTAFSTVLVNFLLQVFMDRLAVLERHSSVTSQQRGVTSRLFWGLFFNTGVIILIVNSDLSPYIGSLSQFILLKVLLPGKYSEFAPDWFYEVGVSILITMFLNAMNPHLFSFLAIPYDSCRRRKCSSKAKNQTELNTIFMGRKFVLYERYSVLLNTVFVVMMYGSGMPLLWLVAAFTFGLTYWFDKTTFLRNYAIPPRYDESLDEYAGNVLPYAVIPHLLLALWFYTSPMTNFFALSDSIPILISDSGVGPIRNGVLDLRQRFGQWNTFPVLVLLLFLVGVWIVRKILEVVFFCRQSETQKRNERMGQEQERSRSRMVTYQEACEKIGLESYRLSRQQEYRVAYIATESHKQLRPEQDLYILRDEAAGGKKKKAPAAGAKRQSIITGVGAVAMANVPASEARKVAPLPPSVATPPGGAAPPKPAWGTEPASETKLLPNSASGSRTGVNSNGKNNISNTPTSSAPEAGEALADETRTIDPAPQQRMAAMTQLNDSNVLNIATAVSNPENLSLIPISCPKCANQFQIVDCGEAMSYTCPFPGCHEKVII